MRAAVEDEGDVPVADSAGAMSGLRGASSLIGPIAEEAVEVRRFMPGGLGACRAFSYNPQALQMILPLMSLRHRGVEVVPQLLESKSAQFFKEVARYEHCCPDIEPERDSASVPVMVIWERWDKRGDVSCLFAEVF